MRWRLTPPRPEAPQPAADGVTIEQIVMSHLDAAHNLARWLMKDPSLAEDVVQDAVVRAMRHFPSYRGGDARAWLMQIVRNVAYTALAARQKESAVTESETGGDDDEMEPVASRVPDPGDGPEALMVRRQELACLERRLAALPAELRECLVLKEYEELSYKQIAEVTGVPVGTVMSRLWRGRQALLAGASDRAAAPRPATPLPVGR